MLFSVQQHGNINVRGFLILKINNFTRIVNVHLYFVMATVPYLLYILARLYLNTTYTVSSIKNGLRLRNTHEFILCALFFKNFKLLNKLQNKQGNYPKQVLLQDNIKNKLVIAGIIHRKLYIVKQLLNQNSGQ